MKERLAVLTCRPYMYFRSPSQSLAHDCNPDALGRGPVCVAGASDALAPATHVGHAAAGHWKEAAAGDRTSAHG